MAQQASTGNTIAASFGNFEVAMNRIRQQGAVIEKKMAHDVVSLDDSEAKRNSLAGALLITSEDKYLTVPHTRPYHLGKLRTHQGRDQATPQGDERAMAPVSQARPHNP